MVLKDYVRPAVVRAGISGKTIGWHSLRHSLATNLRSLDVDVKTAQELLRHANSRTILYLYTRATSSEKRQASGRQLELLIGGSPSVRRAYRQAGKRSLPESVNYSFIGLMVGTAGFEPTTSTV